jgi:hypothetical protein
MKRNSKFPVEKQKLAFSAALASQIQWLLKITDRVLED